MMDYLELGPVPAGEECAQVGEAGFDERAKQECERYVEQLEKMFPEPPVGSYFTVKSFPHDFGRYYEVVVTWTNEAGEDFAFNVERNLPETWEG
jgi:hypothetical protein